MSTQSFRKHPLIVLESFVFMTDNFVINNLISPPIWQVHWIHNHIKVSCKQFSHAIERHKLCLKLYLVLLYFVTIRIMSNFKRTKRSSNLLGLETPVPLIVNFMTVNKLQSSIIVNSFSSCI